MTTMATISARQDGGFTLRSKYDAELVADIRGIPQRTWNSGAKTWEFPAEMAPYLKSLAEVWHIPWPDHLANVEAQRFVTAYQVTTSANTVIFDFPYSEAMVESIKARVPGAAFHRSSKTWRTPIENIDKGLIWAQYHGLRVDPAVQREANLVRSKLEAMQKASYATESDFQVHGIAQELLPYQRAGVEYLTHMRRAILGDEMGLGKGVQALSAAVMTNAFPLIVVCPNSMKSTWAQVEVPKWFPHLTTNLVSGTGASKLPYADVTVCNYDILAARADDILALRPKGLIVDESHYIRNGQPKYICAVCGVKVRVNSKQCSYGHTFQKPGEKWTVRRTEGVMKLARSIPEDGMVVLATGTPVHNRPTDLIPQLMAVGHIEAFGGRHRFAKRYYNEGEPTNVLELNNKLRSTCYIRREKKDVYSELPELRISVQLMEPTEEKMRHYRDVQRDVVEYLAARARQLAEEAGEDPENAYWEKRLRAEAAEHLVRIAALKNACAEIKLPSVQDWVQDFLEDGEKLIAFAEHVSVVETLSDAFAANSVKIRGTVKTADRLAAIDRFQTDPSCSLFVGNIASASEGLTLTAASTVAMVELPWTWEAVKQCAARCYGRTNDLHGAVLHALLVPDTIDMTIWQLLTQKRLMSEAITSGVDPEANKSVLSDLVVQLAKRGLAAPND